jgi:hypothetical protein
LAFFEKANLDIVADQIGAPLIFETTARPEPWATEEVEMTRDGLAVLAGDEIGPEITDATVRVLRGAKFGGIVVADADRVVCRSSAAAIREAPPRSPLAR